jgi:hypothetical protein
MKTKPQQQENKKSNANSKFVRTRNQNEDIPMSASKIKKRIRDVKRTLTKVKFLVYFEYFHKLTLSAGQTSVS